MSKRYTYMTSALHRILARLLRPVIVEVMREELEKGRAATARLLRAAAVSGKSAPGGPQ